MHVLRECFPLADMHTYSRVCNPHIRARAQAMDTGIRARAQAMDTGIRARAQAMDTGIRARAQAMDTGMHAQQRATHSVGVATVIGVPYPRRQATTHFVAAPIDLV
jgi:hypothetical protein